MRIFLTLFFIAATSVSAFASIPPLEVELWNINLYKENCNSFKFVADKNKPSMVILGKAHDHFCQQINFFTTYGYLLKISCDEPMELEKLSQEIDQIPVGLGSGFLENDHGYQVYTWARIIKGLCVNPALK